MLDVLDRLRKKSMPFRPGSRVEGRESIVEVVDHAISCLVYMLRFFDCFRFPALWLHITFQ